MRIFTGFILVGLMTVYSCSIYTDINFNSQKWKNWVETESTMSLRWDMRKDLIKKHKLIGLTINEITDLLGEPEQKTERKCFYNLGSTRHGIDYGTLIIVIEYGKVIDYKIING